MTNKEIEELIALVRFSGYSLTICPDDCGHEHTEIDEDTFIALKKELEEMSDHWLIQGVHVREE